MMDKKRAMELLKQALNEIPMLRTYTPEKQQYKIWFEKICNVLELTFGISSREYHNFSRAVSVDYLVQTDEEKRDKYNKELDAYETALKSAIHKCELLENEQYLGKEIQKHLKGTPEEVAPHIIRIAESFELQTIRYKAVHEAYDSSQFSKRFRIMCGTEVDHLLTSVDGPSPDRHDIGVITLQSLPNNRTLFIPKSTSSSFDSNRYYFGSFLDRLLLEFKNLSIEEATPEKSADTNKESEMIAGQPKAFIAHEGETRSLTLLKEFLETLGIQYFIAESEASGGRSIEKQVDWTQSNADFAICLATKGKAINKKTGSHYMAPNIADELGRARQVFGDRIILLVQKGVEVHTNTREIVYESFTTTNMERAFIKIVKELTNWGYLKVGKI